jgi:hypothetical protein
MGGSEKATSSGSSSSTPLSERVNPAQWALYGPAAAMGLNKAFGNDFSKSYLTDARGAAMANTAGAQNNLSNSLSSQGVNLSSPLMSQLSRGVQTKGIDALGQAQSNYEKLKDQSQRSYFNTMAGMLSAWPPAETTSTQTSTTPTQGGK